MIWNNFHQHLVVRSGRFRTHSLALSSRFFSHLKFAVLHNIYTSAVPRLHTSTLSGAAAGRQRHAQAGVMWLRFQSCQKYTHLSLKEHHGISFVSTGSGTDMLVEELIGYKDMKFGLALWGRKRFEQKKDYEVMSTSNLLAACWSRFILYQVTHWNPFPFKYLSRIFTAVQTEVSALVALCHITCSYWNEARLYSCSNFYVTCTSE